MLEDQDTFDHDKGQKSAISETLKNQSFWLRKLLTNWLLQCRHAREIQDQETSRNGKSRKIGKNFKTPSEPHPTEYFRFFFPIVGCGGWRSISLFPLLSKGLFLEIFHFPPLSIVSTKASMLSSQNLGWHICRAKFARNNLLSYEFLTKNALIISPNILSLFCNSEKLLQNSRKIIVSKEAQCKEVASPIIPFMVRVTSWILFHGKEP